jgi:hypothetical protein
MTLGFILQAIAKGLDDDEDKFAINYLLYQQDRLFSESYFFTPFGLANETKKMVQSPTAATGALTDAMKLAYSLIAFPFQDEDGRTYQTGIYADENKVKVNTYKMIPLINKYQTMSHMDKRSKAYVLFRPIQ